ncbi:DPP IV N-terminal domain-containing protein [Polymorphobacter sp.]|uniref:DPP IV N-terminal domain-containing protein n=1 Tax=Polymorphobacter sp. TaxID=1909290 RepID=UPI003F721C78
MKSQPLTLERVFASPALSGSVPRLLTIAPDGTHLAWLKPRADDLQRYDLWLRDTATGAERMLVDSTALSPAPAELSEAELMRRERARLRGSRGIVDYQWAPDGQSVLVPLDGDIWLAPLKGEPRRLTDTPETELEARLSRKGRYLSMVRNQNLHVLELATGATRALTQDGGGLVSYGLAEFIAQEEMGRSSGHWWSPDDARIAVARIDETRVAVAVRAAIGATSTKVTEQRYPFAGTANVRISLAILDPEGKRPPVNVDLGPDEDIYLARVRWLAADRLVVVRQPRDQSRLDLLDVDVKTGATRLILSTRSKTWVDLHDSLAAIPGSTDLVWLSEESGHRHLYRAQGERLTPITRGDWSVSEMLAIGDGQLLFTGFADTPLEKALYRVPLDGSAAPVRLSLPGHWAEAVADRTGRKALVTSSAPGQPPRIDLIDTRSGTSTVIAAPTMADIPYASYAADHVVPRFGTLKAADGKTDLYYSLLVPKGLKRGARAPVFFEVYGGPGHQQVRNAWGPMMHQWLVRQGWIVFTLDNRGTPGRGTAFRDAIYKGLGTVEPEDQMAGLAWLKAQPFVDPGRVAVYGWSYGGYMVLRLMTKYPDAFAAGIAGAPVTDWTLYDTHYTERYLGNPATDKTPYTASDVTPDAGALARPLLIVHGLADDNVIFDHSARMIAALQKAGRPFRVMPYPGETHGIGDPALRTHLWRTIEEVLAPLAPPASRRD